MAKVVVMMEVLTVVRTDRKETKQEHLLAVRDALKALAMPPEDATRKTTVTYRDFIDPLSGDRVALPGDAARPYSDDLARYIAKLLEFIQCFVTAHRLASQIRKAPVVVLPAGLVLEQHVKRVLRVVGRISGEDRDDELKYYPRPYVRESINVPFVGFAASLATMLMDYVKWAAASESDPLIAAAKAEIRTAIKFLINESTYISGDGGTIGWSFVPGVKCRTDDTVSLSLLRHVHPTSKAVLAIQRFCSDYETDELVGPAKGLLPGVVRWLEGLGKRDPDGFYYATEVDRRPYLDDHCYATDAALALRETRVHGADTIAVDAVKRLATQLNDGWGDLERLVVYDARIEGIEKDVSFENAPCVAQCLAVLSRGTPVLTGAENAEQRNLARRHCNGLLTEVLYYAINEDGLWPAKSVQFRWVLAAIDSLLCYELYAQPKPLTITAGEVAEAADRVLQDKRFREMFRRLLVEQLQSMPLED